MPEQLTVCQSVENFLNSLDVNYAKDLTLRFGPEMETQINVDQSLGEPVYEGTRHVRNTWESTGTEYGTFRFNNIRIPRNAMGADGKPPYYEDRPLRFPLDYVVDCIGMTGWNWKQEQSMWVGFDFDSIAGHVAGVGISDTELDQIRKRAGQIPWVQVRRSTGGSGLHLYVFFDPDALPSTENHHVHAAAARAVLGRMSREVGFDFAPHVDVCGGNMWIWARRVTPETMGLAVIKDHEDFFPGLPENWRDNIDVVTGKRSKVRIHGVSDDATFDATSSSIKKVELTEQHLEVEERIHAMGYSIVWVPDHNCWQTHTKAFQDLLDEYPDDYKGLFKTLSAGDDPGGPNCFAFPCAKGVFRVVRFGLGAREHETWHQDGADWTWCYFNKTPDLRTAATTMGGIEDPDSGGFIFTDREDVEKTMAILGVEEVFPTAWKEVVDERGRQYQLRTNKHNHIVAEISVLNKDDICPKGFIKKKGKFVKLFRTLATQEEEIPALENQDEIVRALKGPAGDIVGWTAKGSDANWISMDKGDIRSVMKSHEVPDPESVLGSLLLNAWRLVNMPFQPEYPGDRKWNREAAQFSVQPGESGSHPHWDLVLEHCGRDLDAAITENEWCQQYGIHTGYDYLLLWVACLFKHPYDALPYLFFYGPQNSGKSIFHEALSSLMTSGVIMADEALKNKSGFNGELSNAILCVVEETDLSKAKEAYNRLKAWVTGLEIRIRPLYQQVYMQRNTTHWVQCANSFTEIPSFPGDTRIVMAWVRPPEREIAKDALMAKLKEEAPAFLRSVLDCRIPPAPGRLRLPVIVTESKKEAEEDTKSALENFIADVCYEVPGACVSYGDFVAAFQAWLSPEQLHIWTKNKVSRTLREKNLLLKGRWNNNQLYFGNLHLGPPKASAKFEAEFALVGQYLKRKIV